MSSTDSDAIVSDYFRRLEALLGGLSHADREQLLGEIHEHVREALAGLPVASEAAVREVLERVGRPDEIAREALADRTKRRRFTDRRILLAVAGVVVVAAVVSVALVSVGSSSPVSKASSAPTAAVGGFPTGIAADQTNGTVYSASGLTSSLSMIDDATCNASTTVGCSSSKTAPTGGTDAIGVVVDDATHTVYAVDGGSNTVAVLDADTCNAHEQTGCAKSPVSVSVPGGPEFIALNETTDTVYVADTNSGTVSVIDGASCNAEDHSGCGKPPATVAVGQGAFPIAVDEATNSVYVGILAGGPAGGSSKSIVVIDGSRCDSTTVSGCGDPVRSISAGSGPAGIALDPTTETLYVSSEDGTVSVIDAGACATASGCAQKATVTVLSDPRGDAFDPATHTLYVTDAGSNSVSMIDTSKCNAEDTAGCTAAAATFPVGESPRRIALDPTTHTAYIVNTLANSVSLIDTASCNATDQGGCPTATAHGTASSGAGGGIAPIAGRPAEDSACSPPTAASASGGPASELTSGSKQVGTGTIDGLTWTLWAKQGETGANALEDGGLVLGGRAYGLCPGYPNPAELELLDGNGGGIVYGVIGYPGAAKIRLTKGTVATFTPGESLPTPSVHVIDGVSFFIGSLPGSACSYPALELDSTSADYSAEHNFGFTGCTPGRLVPITFSQGIWHLAPGKFVNNFPNAPSGPQGHGSHLATTFETCNRTPTATESGRPAGTLTHGSTEVGNGVVGGHSWSLWASNAGQGADSIETGGLVLDNRWYGLCPGPPNPAEFELIDTSPTGIVYGYVANPGPYAISFTPGGKLPQSDLHQVRGGTFFIGSLPRSACAYSELELDASTPAVDDLHFLSFGACADGQLVPVSGGHGSW